MRIVLISDLHGNLPALESFLKELKKEDYDQIWCAGDIVGYYPWPNEVCNWVWENVSYITDLYEAEEVLLVVDKPFTIYGHTHILAVFGFDGRKTYRFEAKGTIELPKGWKFLINPGSIGQPRDGIPLGSYAVWDTEKNTVTKNPPESP